MSVCDPVNGMHARWKGYLPEQFSHPIPETPAQQQSLRELPARVREVALTRA